MSRRRRKAARRGGRRRGAMLAISTALLLVVAVTLIRADMVDRLLHPERYAVTGATLRPADDYVAAARGALGRDERVAALTFPKGLGPVTVAIVSAGAPARTVYLDPPSARVLAVAANRDGLVGPARLAETPLARPAQSVARVIARARPIGGGAVADVEWPTTRSPDWTVGFAGRTGRRIKVADDSGSARPAVARAQGITSGTTGWLIVAGGVLAVACATVLARSKGRVRPTSTRR